MRAREIVTVHLHSRSHLSAKARGPNVADSNDIDNRVGGLHRNQA